MTGPPTGRDLLRHFLAALAYRVQKAVRGAPDGFADFRAGEGVRTPHQLLRHMSDVLGYARVRIEGGRWRALTLPTFGEEVDRFHEQLQLLDRLVAGADLGGVTPQQLLQGPLSDTMTHAGQLAMLRRLSGSPIPPENFIEANIDPGKLGPDQAAPASPDAEWYDAEDEPW